MERRQNLKQNAIYVSLLVFLIAALGSVSRAHSIILAPSTIVVPDNYSSIQKAINSAISGDIIYVRAGTYHENIVVNKTVSLVGEKNETTIIDGNGTLVTPVYIVSNNVTVSGFTIRNSTKQYGYAGIVLEHSSFCNISGNVISDNYDGIFATYSSLNTISGNVIIGNSWNGIHLKSNSTFNTLSSNTISNGENGIDIEFDSNSNYVLQNKLSENEITGISLIGSQRNSVIGNGISSSVWSGFRSLYIGAQAASMNVIYHNNFLNAGYKATVYSKPNLWDNGYPSGGNYWGDYTGSDEDGDGIGDTPYVIDANNVDRYPQMNITPQSAEPLHRIWTVNNNGQADFSTIRQAVVQVNPRDIVFIQDGEYREGQITISRPLRLLAEDNATIIDGGGTAMSFYIESTNNVEINGFSITQSQGLYVFHSSYVSINGNILYNNTLCIAVQESTNCIIYENQVIDNRAIGIQIFGSTGIKVLDNTVSSNSASGIWLENSTSNTIAGNIISNNGQSINGDSYGILLSNSNYNRVYHNDIIENYIQANARTSTNNRWDNGYPSGGNYWSDYAGVDAYGDGLGDTPYIIDEINQDQYPLMHPFSYTAQVPPPYIINQTRMLSLELYGEQDYRGKENETIRVSAFVSDLQTGQPVYGVYATIDIYYPNGNIWISDSMFERTPGSGFFEWESKGTILELAQNNALYDGMYTAQVRAWIYNGTAAEGTLQFRIYQNQQTPGSLFTLWPYIGTGAIILYVATTAAILLKDRRRKLIQ